jgi:hypothetical protein
MEISKEASDAAKKLSQSELTALREWLADNPNAAIEINVSEVKNNENYVDNLNSVKSDFIINNTKPPVWIILLSGFAHSLLLVFLIVLASLFISDLSLPNNASNAQSEDIALHYTAIFIIYSFIFWTHALLKDFALKTTIFSFMFVILLSVFYVYVPPDMTTSLYLGYSAIPCAIIFIILIFINPFLKRIYTNGGKTPNKFMNYKISQISIFGLLFILQMLFWLEL